MTQRGRGRRVRAKFMVGDIVAYKGNRRIHRKIAERYWDATYPGWRYRFEQVEVGMPKYLAACWAVIESELILVKGVELLARTRKG
jgi:hypothetical protein